MRIYQISDCHLQLGQAALASQLIDALRHIEHAGDGDVLLLTGDLVCGPSVEIYAEFKALIHAHTSIEEIYAIAGNHDDIQLMKRVFGGSRIQVKDRVRLSDDLDLVFVDSSQLPINHMPLGAGRVTHKALSALTKLTRKQQSIVVIHHPVLNLGAKWFTRIGIENCQAVIAALHKQTLAVISGHAHAFFKQHIKGDINQLVCPATSYGFEHSNPSYQKNAHIAMMAFDIEPSSSCKLKGEPALTKVKADKHKTQYLIHESVIPITHSPKHSLVAMPDTSALDCT